MCDVKRCHRIPYAEVYKQDSSWNYLCKKHYLEEYEKHGDKYGWLILTRWDKVRAIFDSIKFTWSGLIRKYRQKR